MPWDRIIPILFLLFYPFSVKAFSVAEKMAILVGEEIIFHSELDKAVEFLKAVPGVAEEAESLIRKEVEKRMIQEKLILAEAERETVSVSRSEIESELEMVWSNITSRFPSEEEFLAALRKEGLTERELRNRYYEEIKKKLLGQKLLQKKGLFQVFLSPLEVRRFYEENKDSIAFRPGKVSLAHIFLPILPGEESEKAAQRKILEVYDILIRGGDFEEVANSFSEDEAKPGRGPLKAKKRGGYLGWVKRGTLLPEIEERLFSLKEGEISQPFRTPLGYQVLKCERKRGDMVEARHILIRVEVRREDTLAQKNLASRLRRRILAGESFDSLAKEYSQDPQTRSKGGYIGEFFIPQLFSPFKEVAERLKAGDLSEPVFAVSTDPTGNQIGGFHLIKVLEKEEGKVLSFEEMQAEIRNYLMEKKISERLEEYLQRVAERTYIKRF